MDSFLGNFNLALRTWDLGGYIVFAWEYEPLSGGFLECDENKLLNFWAFDCILVTGL